MATDIDFTVTVDPSSDQSGYHVTGSDIAGKVTFKGNNVIPADYKRITVSLIGKADVYFFFSGESDRGRHLKESDVFYHEQMIVWERNGELPKQETSEFPFTFSLMSKSGENTLPVSAECKDGRIRYTVEAKLIRREVDREIEAAVAYSRVPVSVTVDINRPDLLVQRAIQNDTAVSQGCFGGGTLSLTSSLSRSGYCIGNDKIYVVVKVDSENANRLNSLSVSLLKCVTSYAQGQSSVTTDILTTQVNNRLPAGGVSFSWNAPPLSVQQTDCTLTNCSIIRIHYFIRTSFSGRCINSQNLDLPIIIGNIPYHDKNTSESLETTHGSGYQPSLAPFGQQYEPPAIPFMSASSQSQHSGIIRKDTAIDAFYDDNTYEEVSHNKRLVH